MYVVAIASLVLGLPNEIICYAALEYGQKEAHMSARTLRRVAAAHRKNRIPSHRRRARFRNVACKLSVDTVHCGMIKRFRHRGLEALFRTGSTKGVNPQLAPKLRRALSRLNDGPLPEAMALPGFRLHPLKGDREGMWSVWITGNYRLTFEIDGEDATNVDLEDYH
jgi:proteic killer suppression protein